MKESVEQANSDPGARCTGTREMKRVASKLSDIVMDFCRLRLFDTFTMTELNTYVTGRGEKIAPDSAGRILRMLRAEEKIDYAVVNRSESRYTIRSVE